MNLAADPVNIPAPQFLEFGLSTIDALEIGSSLWTPATRVVRPTDVAHWSAPDHIFGQTASFGDAVSANSDYNYKLILKLGGKIMNLSAKRMQVVDHLLTQLLLVRKFQTRTCQNTNKQREKIT